MWQARDFKQLLGLEFLQPSLFHSCQRFISIALRPVMPGAARVKEHSVTLHCVRVSGELVHPLPMVLQASDTVDLHKLVDDEGCTWRGIFVMRDSGRVQGWGSVC